MPTATKRKPKFDLFEDHAPWDGKIVVDEEAGIIKNCLVAGFVSKNGYKYAEEAFREALPEYENCPVNRDHLGTNEVGLRGEKPRSSDDVLGYLANPRLEADGIRADFVYLKTHPFNARVVEAAKRMPWSFGFSHHAYGKPVKEGGEWVVKKIEAVRSVDLVAEPATTDGLHENVDYSKERFVAEETKVIKKTIKDILGAAFKDADKAVLEAIEGTSLEIEILESDAVAAQADGAFEALLVAAYRDTKMDDKAKSKRFKEVMKARSVLMGKPGDDAEDDGEKPAPKKEETKKEAVTVAESIQQEVNDLKAKTKLLENQIRVRKLCDDLKIVPTDELTEALMSLDDIKGKKLLETCKPGNDLQERRGAPPASGGAATTGGAGDAYKQFLESSTVVVR